MAAAIIDWARVVLLIQDHLLRTTELASRLDIARQHEALAEGSDKPAVKVIGMLRYDLPHRRGGGLSGNESAESPGTIGIVVRSRIDLQNQQQTGLEGALSLLQKYVCERVIDNDATTIGSIGNQMIASGHKVELWGARVEQGFEAEDERDRIASMEIDVRVTRSAGTNDLMCESS